MIGKTLPDLPNTAAVSRKTSLEFPVTELFSPDIALMFTDVELMSVVAVQITKAAPDSHLR